LSVATRPDPENETDLVHLTLSADERQLDHSSR
jgi:hypothetical protein